MSILRQESLPEVDGDEYIALLVQKNEEAWSDLVERCTPGLMQFVSRYTRDIHDAEDIVSEAFKQAVMHIGKFKKGGTLKGWLHVITRNFLIHYSRESIRVERRQVEMPSHGTDDFGVDMASDPLKAAMCKDTFRHIQNSIQDLPAKMREVMHRIFEGEKKQDIIKELQISEAAFNDGLGRARGKLRELLLVS